MSSSFAAMKNFAERLPSAILNIEWNDPVLVVGGVGWSLAITSPWRIVAGDKLLLGSDDADAGSLRKILHGKMVVSCSVQSKHASLDLALMLEGGGALEIFSVAYLEPWTLSLSDVGMFVASPSE